jgi:alpha-amylase
VRALPFFEKDSMQFHAFGRARFYKTLLALRKGNIALDADASFKKLSIGDDAAVYAFVREKAGQKLLVMLNLSGVAQDVAIGQRTLRGHPTDVFMGKAVVVNGGKWTIDPWGYRVYAYRSQ